MIFTDPETGQPWFVVRQSRAERGYWRKGEPRPGVTADDPRRYRRHSLAELHQRGDAADIGYGTKDAAREVYEEKRKAIEEAGSRGAAADVGIQAGVTRHTLLGRQREIKRASYYTRRGEIEEALRAAGLEEGDVEDMLTAWDDEQDIRIVESRDRAGRLGYELYDDGDRMIGRRYSLAELQALAVRGTELEEAFEEMLQREGAAEELVAQIEAAGLTVQDLGFSPEDVPGMLAEVAEALAERRAFVVEGDDWEAVDLDEVPF